MRAALCLLLLGSAALLSGCVDGGPSRSGVRYDDDSRLAREGYYARPPRDNGDRVPEYNEERRPSRLGRDERNMRPDPRLREERRDRAGRDLPDVTKRDTDRRMIRDRTNPGADRDRRAPNDETGRDRDCVYPCIR